MRHQRAYFFTGDHFFAMPAMGGGYTRVGSLALIEAQLLRRQPLPMNYFVHSKRFVNILKRRPIIPAVHHLGINV